MNARAANALLAALIVVTVACGESKSSAVNPIAPTPNRPAPAPTATPQKVIVIGTVWEVPPAAKVIPGARVEVATGPDAGRYMTTGSDGVFRLVDLTPGVITLVVRKEGYQAWQIVDLSIATDAHQDANLFPTPPTDASGATATARCKDATWSWAQTRAAACVSNGGISYGVCPGPICE